MAWTKGDKPRLRFRRLRRAAKLTALAKAKVTPSRNKSLASVVAVDGSGLEEAEMTSVSQEGIEQLKMLLTEEDQTHTHTTTPYAKSKHLGSTTKVPLTEGGQLRMRVKKEARYPYEKSEFLGSTTNVPLTEEGAQTVEDQTLMCSLTSQDLYEMIE